MNLTRRPRRLRTTAAMRALTAETALRPEQLIQVFSCATALASRSRLHQCPASTSTR